MAQLVMDKDPYKGRYVCGICGKEVIVEPKPHLGVYTWRIVCPQCGTLMSSGGIREELISKALKLSYIKLNNPN